MKTHPLLSMISHRALAAGAVLALTAPFVSAQDLVWNTEGTGGGSGDGGSGDWSTTAENWRTSPTITTPQVWGNDPGALAIFVAPQSGKSAGPVTVTEDIIGRISLRAPDYTINGPGIITIRNTGSQIESTYQGTGSSTISNNIRIDLADSASSNSLNRFVVRDTAGTADPSNTIGRTITLDGNITAFSSVALTSASTRTVRLDFAASGTESAPNRIILNGNVLVDPTNFGTPPPTTNVFVRFGEAGNNFGIYEVNGDNSALNFGTTSATLVRGTLLAGHDNALGVGRVDMGFGGGNDSYAALLANGARTLTNNIQWNQSSAVTDQSNLVREFGSATAHVSNFNGNFSIQNPQGSGTVDTTQTVRFSAVEDGRANFTGAIADTGLTRFESTGAGVVNLAASAGITGSGAGSGGFDVLAGTLLVNNLTGSATGSGAVSVAAGATLGGAGFISGATTVDGIIAPGNSIGTLTIDNTVTWNYNSGSDWKFELGTAGADINTPGTSDFLNITGGNFTMGTGTGFGFDFEGTGELGWYHLVQWSGTSNFDASDFFATNLAGGLQGAFDINDNGLYLNVIPEPSTAGLLAVALLGYAVYSRRRAARTATQVA